jgi:hypothetical protein
MEAARSHQRETRDITGDVTVTDRICGFCLSRVPSSHITHEEIPRIQIEPGPGGGFEEMSKSPLGDSSPINKQAGRQAEGNVRFLSLIVNLYVRSQIPVTTPLGKGGVSD